MTAVTIDDGFWAPKLEINRTVTIPHILKENDDTGRVANFEKAARQEAAARTKDGASTTPTSTRSSRRRRTRWRWCPIRGSSTKLDELIQLIAESQEKDGYLFPARTIDPQHPAPGVGPERWIYENGSHELYNAGHLYEAAVAHFEATGKRTLLDVAIRNADLVCRTFGPNGRHAVSGHEEIELALVKLYRATGNATYLKTAEWLVAERGKPHPDMPPYPDKAFEMYNDRAYKQDQAPVVEQDRAVGHAVRAMYSVRGGHRRRGADRQRRVREGRRSPVAGRRRPSGCISPAASARAARPSRSARTTSCRIFAPTPRPARRSATISGTTGCSCCTATASTSTCSSACSTTACSSGVSLAGNTFFYQNPLESNGRAKRTEYFDVACCPANLARLLEQLPGRLGLRADRATRSTRTSTSATTPT